MVIFGILPPLQVFFRKAKAKFEARYGGGLGLDPSKFLAGVYRSSEVFEGESGASACGGGSGSRCAPTMWRAGARAEEYFEGDLRKKGEDGG